MAETQEQHSVVPHSHSQQVEDMPLLKWKRKNDDVSITLRLDTEALTIAGYKYEKDERYPILLVTLWSFDDE